MELYLTISRYQLECKHYPVSRRCGMSVKGGANTKDVERLIRIIFISFAQLSVRPADVSSQEH